MTTSSPPLLRDLATGCLWAARLLSLGLALLVVAFAVGEGLRPAALSPREALLFGLLGMAVVGNLAAWRFGTGAAGLALAAALGFTAVNLAATPGRLPGPWVLAVLFAPSLLYFLAALVRRLETPLAV